MSYVVKRNATFLVPSGSVDEPEKLHLHVVSTNPCENNKCLLLTISTIKAGLWFDRTRTVASGSHPFISAESYVNYRHAVVKNCATIAKSVDGWLYITKGDFHDALTDYILSGVRESEMTPKYVIDYLDSLGL
jgi:hypothetical protein